MSEVRIVSEQLDVLKICASVSDSMNGAICTFIGQTRNNARSREVAYLEYNAYVPMAEKQLKIISDEAEKRWGCSVVIHHRLGRVDPGEASVIVAVGSPHRGDGFEACRFCIDTLKKDVPIWKKETCPDGSFWIEGDEAINAD